MAPSSRSITVERRAAADGLPPLELRRSTRRRKTASAHARDGVVVVQLPAGLPPAEERRIIKDLAAKVTGEVRARQAGGDQELARRARRLADRYVDGVRAGVVRWSGRMTRRHGSCTPGHGTIRVSRVLATYPEYVLDYVLVHELAHLVVSGHTDDFRNIVDRYPQAERARGFLEGVAQARAPLPPDALTSDDEPDHP